MDDKADQDRVEVAEVGRDHDHRPLFRQPPQHFYFADDRDLIPQRVPAAEEAPEFFYPGAVDQPSKPTLDNFTRKTIGPPLEAPARFIGIAAAHHTETLLFLLSVLLP